MQFHRGKKRQTKKPQEFVWKFIEKHMEIHETKIPRPATKKDKISIAVSARPRSHSLIDNCSLFIRYKEYKSQATSYKYGLCSHSLQQSRRQYSFFSRSAKPADSLKQLHINFAWVSERRLVVFLLVLTFVTVPKIQIHSNFDGCTSKFFFFL